MQEVTMGAKDDNDREQRRVQRARQDRVSIMCSWKSNKYIP